MLDPREDLFERDGDDFEIVEPILSAEPQNITSRRLQRSSSTISLPAVFDDDEDICFPAYECGPNNKQKNILSRNQTISSVPSPPCSELGDRSEDDTAAHARPSRHVDYLTHEWSEEEIWSSLKWITARRKEHPNSERLMNASWRCWEKLRRNLKTVPCGIVMWLKDHDVTWLYGPLVPCRNEEDELSSSVSTLFDSPSDSPSLGPMRPILKKLSLSQRFLNHSLSNASIKSQSTLPAKMDSPHLNPIPWDSTFASANRPSIGQARSVAMNSRSSYPGLSPWSSPKSVRFHHKVHQCIALPSSTMEEAPSPLFAKQAEDVVMMHPLSQGSKKSLPQKPRNTSPPPQTITVLPDARLKCPTTGSDGAGLRTFEGPPMVITPTNSEFSKEDSSNGNVETEAHEEDDEENEDETTWNPPSWLHNRKDSVQNLRNRLDKTKSKSNISLNHRPNLERRDVASKSMLQAAKGHVMKGHDCSIAFKLPPCRAQLDSYSFPKVEAIFGDGPLSGDAIEYSPPSMGYFPQVSTHTDAEKDDDPIEPLSQAKLGTVNRIMDEFWVVYNDMEHGALDEPRYYTSLPAAVRRHISDMIRGRDIDEEAVIENLTSIIVSCREQLTPALSVSSERDRQYIQARHPTQQIQRPRFSSDSGYGSEEVVDKALVRDVSTALSEKERGVKDWDLHPEVWDDDELDEATAWERGY